MLSPFLSLDIEGTYDRYQSGIDFVLYMLLLTFITRVSLSRMFPGGHGRKLATVIGIILGISLSATTRALDFSLKSFGPVAAGLVIFMVGLVIHNLLRHSGVGRAASGSTALIVTYFTMRAIQPGFFLWAGQNQWLSYLHSLLLLAVLVALWRVIHALFAPRNTVNLRGILGTLPEAGDGPVDTAVRSAKGGLSEVKRGLASLTTKGLRDSADIVVALTQLIHLTQRHGDKNGAGPLIAKELSKLEARQHHLQAAVTRLQTTDRRLARSELVAIHELKPAARLTDPARRKQCQKIFLEERESLDVENRIAKLGADASRHASEFNLCVRNAAGLLRSGGVNEAVEWMERGLHLEKQAMGSLEKIQRLEKELIGLMEGQLAQAAVAPGK